MQIASFHNTNQHAKLSLENKLFRQDLNLQPFDHETGALTGSGLFFGVCSTTLLLQWHVKDPGHSAKSAGGKLHLNIHTPLAQRSWSGLTMPLEWAKYAIVQAQCGNLSRDELTCNLFRNVRPQSFQLAGPLWTDPGIQSGISMRKLISTLDKNQNKHRQGMNSRTLPPKIASKEKATTATTLMLEPKMT